MLGEFFQKYAKPIARVWFFLKVLAVLAGVGVALIYATNATRLEAISSVKDDFTAISLRHGELLQRTEPLISSTFAENVTPSPNDLIEVRESAASLLAALSGFEAPSDDLRDAREAYRRVIERLLGSINAYDGSIESYKDFQNASVKVVNKGGDLRVAVEDFTSSTWTSFWGAL
jgi:hypothetical protein